MPDPIMWYESGNWPLIGAIMATIISNGVLIWQTLKGFRLQQKETASNKNLEYNNLCLEKWYSPLYALLTENELVYKEFGPPSYVHTDYQKAEIASKRWEMVLNNVVYPNLKSIENILKEQIAYIHKTDRFDLYKPLLLHVISASLNDAMKTELAKNFKYPSEVKNHIYNKIQDIKGT